MNFSNSSSPFMNIYQEMLFKLYNNYLYHPRQSNQYNIQYLIPKLTESYISPGSSIDDILTQDSDTLLDKIKNTALNVADRIKIHRDINTQLDYNWYNVRKYLLEMASLYPGMGGGSQRRNSTLISESFKVYKDRMDEQVACWRDLQEPMRYFINLFHQYKNLKQDQKMLDEK